MLVQVDDNLEQNLKRRNDFLENRISCVQKWLLPTQIRQKGLKHNKLFCTVFMGIPKIAAPGLSCQPCPGLAERQHSAFPNHIIYRFKKFWSRIARPKQVCD